ncbi:Uncharacterized protein HZ326_20262 [Fusarium oxysporum f. sp. albedinis]|nr:Uncharacterized protein HZ326_20262 [Fusarium oxysporum f. sp. albedinis]
MFSCSDPRMRQGVTVDLLSCPKFCLFIQSESFRQATEFELRSLSNAVFVMSSKSFNESCKLSDELLSISGQLHQLTIQRSPLQLNSRQLPCILTLQEPPYDLGDGENSSSLHIYGLRPSDTDYDCGSSVPIRSSLDQQAFGLWGSGRDKS